MADLEWNAQRRSSICINHYDAAVRNPEVQSCVVLTLSKSLNKPVRVVGGLFGAIPQLPRPVAGRVLVFDVERFTFRKVTPYIRRYSNITTPLHEYICKANSKYI